MPSAARSSSTKPDWTQSGSRLTTPTTTSLPAGSRLRPGDDPVVVDRQETEALVSLQGDVAFRRAFTRTTRRRCCGGPRGHDGGPRTSPSGGTPRCPARPVVPQQLEHRAVDAVVGREPGRQHEAGDERGPAAMLEAPGEDVRRVRPDVRPEVRAAGAVGELLEVRRSVPTVVSPREVRVGLVEADLGEPVHDLRAA